MRRPTPLLHPALSFIAAALICTVIFGCTTDKQNPRPTDTILGRPYDENIQIPSGDPDFPRLGAYWVVDPDSLISATAIRMASETLENLKTQRIAEIVVVVRKGIKHPAQWCTHYGRWLRLGEIKGSHQNNGIVFLIIPDAYSEHGKVWYSIGRGLPRLTSSDIGPIVEEAASYANAGDLDGAVISIARNIHDILQRIYGGEEE